MYPARRIDEGVVFRHVLVHQRFVSLSPIEISHQISMSAFATHALSMSTICSYEESATA